MEDIPPSYYQSTNPSVLDLIAPYLVTQSLHALTLVSKSYHAVFMPHLWGSPASHFVPMDGASLPGDPDDPQASVAYDDLVYVALTRFKRVLKKARPTTRQLVHTLLLPPAVSEIYGGPNATWLREILDGLPNLQSLCVGGLPFFDHHSLVAVDRSRTSDSASDEQVYPLRLLLASKEPNTTSTGLSLFLPHVRNLIYLDLSYTTPARDVNVLSSLAVLQDVQVLKLRGIGLRDPEAEVLANAIGLRVRLLDVAENLLSDMGMRSLLQACVLHSSTDPQKPGPPRRYGPSHVGASRRQLESWPVSLPPAPDFLSLDTLRSADFDKNLRVQLTHPLTGRLAFEDIPHAGLTHLYVTGNPGVTVESIRSWLNTGRLHVLDAGELAAETIVDKYVRSAIDTGRWQDRPRSMMSTSSTGSIAEQQNRGPVDGDMQFPGAEKLIPVIRHKASKNLTYLRIDHAIITKECEYTVQDRSYISSNSMRAHPTSRAAELSGQIGVTQKVEIPGDNHFAAEMPADQQVFELDGTPTIRAELPGDPIHFAVSPPISESPTVAFARESPSVPIRGEGAYAPEVVVKSRPVSDQSIVLNATGSGYVFQRPDSSHSVHSPISPMTPTGAYAGPAAPAAMNSVLNGVLRSTVPSKPTPSTADRRKRIDRITKARPPPNSPSLHPSSVPHLRVLKLTNIPSQVPQGSSVIKSLQAFIVACASESYLAVLQAKTNYSLPPGRARLAAEREHARSLFALQTIVLETVPVVQDMPSQRDWKHTRQRLNISKSSTGDHDSEALWSAAENDFSFFGEEGEEADECGIYEHEPAKYFPSIAIDEKFAVSDDAGTSTSGSGTMWSNDSDSLGVNSPVNTVFQSPRQLPLGRNRRSSSEQARHSTASSSSNHRLSSPTTMNNTSRFQTMELPGDRPSSSQSYRHSHANAFPRSGLAHELLAPNSPTTSVHHHHQLQPALMVDTITELSKFRKDRKAAYEAELRRRSRVDGVYNLALAASAADSDIFIEGHWKGEIKVVRTNGVKTAGEGVGALYADGGKRRMQRDGMVDIYGNYFEKGYLYS